MLILPNAKINIGLKITGKRPDGFHSLETVFYPLYGLMDALEFIPSSELSFHTSGFFVEGVKDDNLVIKAYRLLARNYSLPPLAIHLHKAIPTGAGLGGGSADASFMLRALDSYFRLQIPTVQLMQLSSELGSDCPFFITNQPALATGCGEILEPILTDLSGYSILVVKPPFGVSTQEAYAGVVPALPVENLKSLLQLPVNKWKDKITNDFEPTVFRNYPELAVIKQKLYDAGAVYASLSGSGSAMYGIFKEIPLHIEFPLNYYLFRM